MPEVQNETETSVDYSVKGDGGAEEDGGGSIIGRGHLEPGEKAEVLTTLTRVSVFFHPPGDPTRVLAKMEGVSSDATFKLRYDVIYSAKPKTLGLAPPEQAQGFKIAV